MLNKIRDILLTKYIGSILVALLAWQALVELVVTVLRISFWFINNQRSQPALGSLNAPFPWDSLVSSAVMIGMYLLFAYFLARWIYPVIPLSPTLADGDVEPTPDGSS